MHVHRHACFELQSQRCLGIVARCLGEKRVDAIREQEALAGEYGRLQGIYIFRYQHVCLPHSRHVYLEISGNVLNFAGGKCSNFEGKNAIK
jgi:hypothetical protein